MLAPQDFVSVFTGDSSLHKRPMGRVIKPLSQMGAHIVGRAGNTKLPITVVPAGKKLQGFTYDMPVASAQVKSAILLAGLFAEGTTTVVEPYQSRNHTELMLESFGVKLDYEGTAISIQAQDKLIAPEEIVVPGDISSAAFWLVAASVIPDSELLLKNVGINPTRTGILDVLNDMGADITLTNERSSGSEPVADILVRSASLHGTSFGADIMPRLVDEIPAITVAAMFAEGETVITGAGELRVKETDRIQAISDQFNKLCDCITATEDGLIIRGGSQNVWRQGTCFSYDDHRIAMTLAIAGMAGNGVEIEQDDALSLEIKSTRQVAKATPRDVEPDAESAPAASDAAEPAEESGQTDAKAAQPNRAAVNDSVAFHETEASATVEAPDETSDSLGSSLETILARRNG